MWTSWPCRTIMSIGKRPRGVSEGAETPQEQLEPHNVTSVMVAAVRPSAATIWGKIGDKRVEIMLDSGSSISLIQESIVTPFSDKNNISPSGLQLTSASGDNIPILGCITLPLCIGELQTSHSLVVVKSLITPVILGLDFSQKYRMILDFTSSSVKIDSKLDTSNFNDCSENSKSMLDVARQIRNKVCAVKTLNDTTEETIDDCAVPLFSKNLLQYDIPECNVPAVVPLPSQYKHLFKTCPGKTTVTEHFISTTGTPVKVPPRRIPANYRSEVENLIQTMLQEGVIEECSSPWMAPAVFIRKKTGDIRICVDYRELNKKTTKEAYPLPRPDEVQDRLSGSIMFSTLDLRSGYWQLPVNPAADRRKIAFCPGPGLGLFQFYRMPFGLSGAPGSFQRLMDMLFHDFSFVTTYLDGVLVHHKTLMCKKFQCWSCHFFIKTTQSCCKFCVVSRTVQTLLTFQKRPKYFQYTRKMYQNYF